ncbi:hypothetical protein AA103196_3075 [Ameyamaea chiangmaiensis NBRC 103196]|uniref:Lipoprotein n=1 Tax=Ameyamaea chiangmaiensis TaxID=442969 RepID=A0A850PEM6_9PROT|nr:hypothetical protein [Ameyamaea chiangmaiensis]MBS4074560.1 hypothetical protein [Ameyamaea chiangmaiensis]NVN39521.1 hypothetical protein [Ameyamaea chiangmaiensis]GBQ72480.1 hypothetical protein AA103196_3075 [Ameyamaea chiangmaiensis NBRC 103196]
MPRRHRRTLPATLALVAVLGGCAPYGRLDHVGDALAAAGFTAHPADTTARQVMLDLLPAATMTWRPSLAGRTYLYADPVLCGCVYMGTTVAYLAYRQSRPTTAAEESAMVAENNRHPGWDWSVWATNADPGPTRPIHAGGDTL